MDYSMPGLPVPQHLPEFAQVHVHWKGDTIQPSHALLPFSPFDFNHSQHQGLFQWVGCLIRWPTYWSFSFSISPLEVFRFVLLLFSCQVVSDSSWLHELQHARLPCLFPSPGVCPSSCPLHWWCHPTISSSVTLSSFCLQSFLKILAMLLSFYLN